MRKIFLGMKRSFFPPSERCLRAPPNFQFSHGIQLFISSALVIKSKKKTFPKDNKQFFIVAAIFEVFPLLIQKFFRVFFSYWIKQTKKNKLFSFLCSFDARGKNLQEAVHWQDEAVLRSKAYFYYDTIPPALKIKNVKTDDAGLYR